MNTCWLYIMIPIFIISEIIPCTGQQDTKWTYPYYYLQDYLSDISPEMPKVEYYNSRDGTYHFKYDTGHVLQQSFRGETRDRNGKVTGYYGHIDPNGVLRLTEYIATNFGYKMKTSARYPVSSGLVQYF